LQENHYREQACWQKQRGTPPTCVHTSNLHLNTNTQHIGARCLNTRYIQHDKYVVETSDRNHTHMEIYNTGYIISHTIW
jgi:hypothetical protein